MRFANGAQTTNEYQDRLEYDTGYRDGFKAANEKAAAEIAVLKTRIEGLHQSLLTIAKNNPKTYRLSADEGGPQ